MSEMKKIKMPKCPNCKKHYSIKELVKKGGENFNFVISHGEEPTTCPFGLESYQNTIEECVESVEDYIKEEFSWIK